MRAGRGPVLVVLVAAAGLLLGPGAGAAQRAGGGEIIEYRVPTRGAEPYGITVGADGNIWFTESAADKIGTVNLEGTFREWPLDFFEGSGARDITLGSNGHLWFTETNVDLIGRVEPSGRITHYPVPSGFVAVLGIAAAPDGTIWFTESNEASQIGILFPPLGYIEEIALGGVVFPAYIAAGPDGNMWFTGELSNQIGRIDPADRSVTYFGVPTETSLPWNIAAGPDGNMWYTSLGGRKIGRITPSGQITEFPIPDGFGSVPGIAPGFDGNMWFVQSDAGLLGAITMDGVFLPSISTGGFPSEVVAGPDGAMWFTERFANVIATTDIAGVGDASVVSTDSGFLMRTVTVPIGGEVRWLFQGAHEHSVTSRDGLFDTGLRPIGSLESITFDMAGTFRYTSLAKPRFRGRVEVPVAAPGSAERATPFTVTWADTPPPPGYVFDVEVRTPGSTGWTAWRSGVTSLGGAYVAERAGPHSFRASVRAVGGSRTGWSPVRTVEVG
jgi:streptogramin lyase